MIYPLFAVGENFVSEDVKVTKTFGTENLQFKFSPVPHLSTFMYR